MHRNTEIVVAAAERLGLHIEPVTYPDGTRTAEDAARAIGVDVAQIVKSLVFDLVPANGEVRPVIALVSGANRLDEAKLATASGAERVGRVDADRVRAVTGFPIGGVPPFGHPTSIPHLRGPGPARPRGGVGRRGHAAGRLRDRSGRPGRGHGG